MKHQTNMRGSNKHGDQSEFHRHPNLSAIFGNAFSPALGSGLRTIGSHETHCRTNSNRTATLAPIPLRLTVTRSDKAQSPFSSWSSSYELKSNLVVGLTGSHAKIAGHSLFHIACGILPPRGQWADGRRVSRSRSLSILCAALLASFLAISPAQAGVSTSCLPRSVKTKLAYIERHFGRVEVISAYRKNAVIAGTRKRSKHSFCGAADFHVHGNRKGAAAWLLKQNGEFIRYSGHHTHWHIADGNWKGWKR